MPNCFQCGKPIEFNGRDESTGKWIMVEPGSGARHVCKGKTPGRPATKKPAFTKTIEKMGDVLEYDQKDIKVRFHSSEFGDADMKFQIREQDRAALLDSLKGSPPPFTALITHDDQGHILKARRSNAEKFTPANEIKPDPTAMQKAGFVPEEEIGPGAGGGGTDHGRDDEHREDAPASEGSGRRNMHVPSHW